MSRRSDVLERIDLCLPTFHSYGHKVSCQVLCVCVCVCGVNVYVCVCVCTGFVSNGTGITRLDGPTIVVCHPSHLMC